MNDRKKMMAVEEMVITALSLSLSLLCGVWSRRPRPRLSQNFQCSATSIELSSLDIQQSKRNRSPSDSTQPPRLFSVVLGSLPSARRFMPFDTGSIHYLHMLQCSG